MIADNNTDPNFMGVSTLSSGMFYTGGPLFSDSLVFDSVVISPSGNGPNSFILKCDSAGNALWGKGIENIDLMSVVTDSLHNVFISGAMYDSVMFDTICLPFPGGGSEATFIAKYDSAGNALWAKGLEDAGGLNGAILTIGLNSSVYVYGNYQVNNYNVGSNSLQLNGLTEIFIAKLDTGPTQNCSAFFTVYPDTIPHNWIAINQTTGDLPITYLWDWGDGTTSGGSTPSHIYSTPGYYNICLNVTDATGCNSVYCDSSTYLYKTGGDNGVVTVNVVLAGILQQGEFNSVIVAFPNPATDFLTFNCPFSYAVLTLYDVTGRILMSKSFKSEITVDLRNFISGIYIVELRDSIGNYWKGKVMKK